MQNAKCKMKTINNLVYKLAIFFSCTLMTVILKAQENDDLSCGLVKIGIKSESILFENPKENVIRLIWKEFSSIENIKPGVDRVIYFDTITVLRPFETFIGGEDLRISQDDFEKVELINSPETSVLFVKYIDFIGDSALDKIELVEGDFENGGERPVQLKLYQNVDGKYDLLEECVLNFWTQPLKFYVSKIKYLDMSPIIFLLAKDKLFPNLPLAMHIIYRVD